MYLDVKLLANYNLEMLNDLRTKYPSDSCPNFVTFMWPLQLPSQLWLGPFCSDFGQKFFDGNEVTWLSEKSILDRKFPTNTSWYGLIRFFLSKMMKLYEFLIENSSFCNQYRLWWCVSTYNSRHYTVVFMLICSKWWFLIKIVQKYLKIFPLCNSIW